MSSPTLITRTATTLLIAGMCCLVVGSMLPLLGPEAAPLETMMMMLLCLGLAVSSSTVGVFVHRVAANPEQGPETVHTTNFFTALGILCGCLIALFEPQLHVTALAVPIGSVVFALNGFTRTSIATWIVGSAILIPSLRHCPDIATAALIIGFYFVLSSILAAWVGTSLRVRHAPRRVILGSGALSRDQVNQFADTAMLGPGHQVDDGLQAQKLESLGVLAGGIAHDFNNLLMSIQGNTSLLLTELNASPARDAASEINIASKRARELVGQLLAYSGKGAFEVKQVNLNDLVHEMSQLLRTAASRCRLQIDCCPDACLVEADATQLRQVVMNLITNAADATPPGGDSVHVRTYVTTVTREILDSTLLGQDIAVGQYAVIEVQDHGHGMDVATVAKIFDPFFTTKFTGRGLGLAAVLGIVRNHGGTLSVASTHGKGTEFRIYLPLSSATTAAEEPISDHGSLAPWPMTPGQVLVVDDEAMVVRVTKRMFEKLGYDVVTASDGAEATKLYSLNREHISLVMLDLTMPVMDGLEAHRLIRDLDPQVGILLTSGYSEHQLETTLTDINTSFIQKPYTLNELTKAIDHALAESRALTTGRGIP